MKTSRSTLLVITGKQKQDLSPVVQKIDSAICWINHYPLDNAIGLCTTYPLDSRLSGG